MSDVPREELRRLAMEEFLERPVPAEDDPAAANHLDNMAWAASVMYKDARAANDQDAADRADQLRRDYTRRAAGLRDGAR